MKTNLLIFGTKSFNNSINELKEDLGFSFTFFDSNKLTDSLISNFSAIIIDNQICDNQAILSIINKILNKPILLLQYQNSPTKCKYVEKIFLPINISELRSKIANSITAYKFNKNSTIKIKNFILDKNEKKLRKDNIFITITEREAQLIELLFYEKKPLSKSIILKRAWKYADDADTHTVETHIYRLRKKILDKFKEPDFIINSKLGYSI